MDAQAAAVENREAAGAGAGCDGCDAILSVFNGGDHYVRYRTGAAAAFTTVVTLAQPSEVPRGARRCGRDSA